MICAVSCLGRLDATEDLCTLLVAVAFILGPVCLKPLAEALKHNNSVTTIDVSRKLLFRQQTLHKSVDVAVVDNCIGDEGMKTIGEVLKHNTSITSINLCCKLW